MTPIAPHARGLPGPGAIHVVGAMRRRVLEQVVIVSRRSIVLCIIGMLALAVGPQVSADIYVVTANVPVQISPPVAAASQPLEMFIRARGGEWQTCDYEVRDGRVIISPDPKKLGGPEMILVINPPADLVLDDHKPPIILGVKADGKPLAADYSLELGKLVEAPGFILWGVADRENALDPNSLKVLYDDRQLSDEAVSVDVLSKRQVGISVDLEDVEYGRHALAIRISDIMPGANEMEARVGFELVDLGNLIQMARDGVVVKVDSSYQSYPLTDPLIDGFKMLDGSGAGNDVTWASAEMDAAHWIEITLPEPKPMSEATVYWAYSGQTFHTSQHIQIQVPDNGGWRTVAASGDDALSPQRNHTFRFDEVTTDRVRVCQPQKGGPIARPDLMWVAEVEVR